MPIGTVPIPVTHVTDDPLLCVSFNVEWLPAILAMVSPARYPEFWAGTLDENRRARLEVQNLIELLQLGEDCGMTNTCCVPPVIIRRVDPATGNPQQSTDGGVTWGGVPDSLSSYIYDPIPPVTSGVADSKCDATENVMGQIDEWITQVTNDFDTATSLLEFGAAVLEAILIAVLTILSAGTLTAVEAAILPLIAAALGAAWSAGKAVFVGYWTDENKAIIKCAVYCNIGSDGAFSDAQFSAFWTKCNSDLPPSPAKMLFMGFLSSVGRPGLDSMAASGLSSGSDCSDCSCFNDCASHWSIFGDNIPEHYHGQITEYGDGFIMAQSGTVTGGNYYLLIRTGDKDTCCCVPMIEATEGSYTFVG